MDVKPKKQLGQHFLKDKQIARNITEALTLHGGYKHVLEIGPGTGVLTEFLAQRTDFTTIAIDIDRESVAYLKQSQILPESQILHGDVLRMNVAEMFPAPLGIIGNLPYNISSQIFFLVFDNRHQVTELVCMIQKEVADRICAKPGNKTIGILSILLQAFYDIDYLIKVPPHVFNPPPKVQSAVIRLRRNTRQALGCDEKLFVKLVKAGYNNRRKTLRNALKVLQLPAGLQTHPFLDKRAEQLSVEDFISLTQEVENLQKS